MATRESLKLKIMSNEKDLEKWVAKTERWVAKKKDGRLSRKMGG